MVALKKAEEINMNSSNNLDLAELMKLGSKIKRYQNKPKHEEPEDQKQLRALYREERREMKASQHVPLPNGMRETLISERGLTCEICELELFEHVHHIDRDPTNNDYDNLQLVCISCHQQLHGKQSKE